MTLKKLKYEIIKNLIIYFNNSKFIKIKNF